MQRLGRQAFSSTACTVQVPQEYPFSRKIVAHRSCVNALVFSNGNGRWLASGGDDRQILLWDLHQEDLLQPSCAFTGPQANIFTIAFSSSNQHLYAGGLQHFWATDDPCAIFKYHLNLPPATSSQEPSQVLHAHTATIRAISCHPSHEDVLLSACEDGKIFLHDAREQWTRAQSTMQIQSELADVRWHPLMEHTFATGDQQGNVCLRDARMAFGPMVSRHKQGVVHTYATKLAKPSLDYHVNPEVSSLVFDKEGQKLAVTFLGFRPTIYVVDGQDPYPLAICSGNVWADGTSIPAGEQAYRNEVTVKHGSFGGPEGELYVAGSDDFHAYVWSMPRIGELREARQEFTEDEWLARGDEVVGFAETSSGSHHVPLELSAPVSRLAGHRSIVTSALFHPWLPLVVTAGVERSIRLHGPTSGAPFAPHLARTPDSRSSPLRSPESTEAATDEARSNDVDALRAALNGPHATLRDGHGVDSPRDGESSQDSASDQEDAEDDATIALFDGILRTETLDIWEARRWHEPSDSDSESLSDHETRD